MLPAAATAVYQVTYPHRSLEMSKVTSLTSHLASRPVSKSAKGSLVESTIDVFERPMTPTPYSTLRKASETSQLGNDDGRIPLHHPQSSVMQDDASNDISVAGSANDASLAHSVAAPRDEASPEQPGVHPLFRSSITSSKSRHAQDTGDKTQRSGHSGRGSVDVSAPAGKPHGITTLKPAEDMETRISVGALMRNFSIKSRAPTTAGEDTVPDLESLRRGPRIRHSRLPPSPSMAVNHAWQLPKSTREMWSITDRSRNMSIISAVVLELSILSFVSSVTAMIMSPMEHGDPATGTVVGTVVSGAFAVAFAVLLWFSLLQYRKTSKDLVSGETWIEMHRRSRPLPRRPDSEERQQDNAATQAWKKFAQDHAQLRRYVEYLESRVGILEEGQPTNTDQHNDGSSAGATRASSSAIGGAENGIGYGRVDHNGGSTPKARNFKVGGSLSRRELLPRDDTAAEPEDWRDGENRAAIPQSDTRTSILTELCAAVTEYSPLSEQMPRGSGHFGQVSNNNTPSVRPRGNTLRGYLTVPDRAVIHQRGVQSIDILRGKVEGV